MENSQKQNAKKVRKKVKISLDQYLHFFSNKQLFLTVDNLNQIIRFHGYRKIIGVPKNLLIETATTIDLVNPCRSTLKDSISSDVLIPLEDMISDLKDLKWQECCVTSVLTFSSWKQTDTGPDQDLQDPKLNQNVPELECPVSSCWASKKRRRKLGSVSKINKTVAEDSGVKDGSLVQPSSLSSA